MLCWYSSWGSVCPLLGAKTVVASVVDTVSTGFWPILSAESGKNEKGLPPNPKKQSPPKSKVFMVVISEREGRVNKSAS